MKNINKYLVAAMLLITSLFFIGCEKETAINEKELPEQAKLFLATHFPGESIASAIKDKEGNSNTYEVVMANGININFDENGKCISMDGYGKRLPDSSLPTQILVYVQANYQNHFITDWGFESFGQKVELSNEIELGFEIDGDFIKIL